MATVLRLDQTRIFDEKRANDPNLTSSVITRPLVIENTSLAKNKTAAG